MSNMAGSLCPGKTKNNRGDLRITVRASASGVPHLQALRNWRGCRWIGLGPLQSVVHHRFLRCFAQQFSAAQRQTEAIRHIMRWRKPAASNPAAAPHPQPPSPSRPPPNLWVSSEAKGPWDRMGSLPSSSFTSRLQWVAQEDSSCPFVEPGKGCSTRAPASSRHTPGRHKPQSGFPVFLPHEDESGECYTAHPDPAVTGPRPGPCVPPRCPSCTNVEDLFSRH